MENNSYSNADMLNLFYIHGECQRIVARTCRRFNDLFPNLPQMTPRKFLRFEGNFLNFGTVHSARIQVHPITEDEGNEINVLAYFHAYPHASITGAKNDLGISRTSIWRILHRHNMHGYKQITLQALHPDDPPKRVDLCEMFLIRTQEDPDFLKRIIWTDEAKFSREGVFNRQNNHFWATNNPHFIRERGYQNKFSFNVFCLLMDTHFSIYIYNENLTSHKYLEILRTTVSDFLDDLPLIVSQNCWYQLDGAPAHCTHDVSRELYAMFADRWIRREGPWSWPPRSPDLNPLDFFLWGRIKELVYKTPVNSREDLENRVRRAFEQLDPAEIQRATTSHVMTCVTHCLHENGQHFKHLTY